MTFLRGIFAVKLDTYFYQQQMYDDTMINTWELDDDTLSTIADYIELQGIACYTCDWSSTEEHITVSLKKLIPLAIDEDTGEPKSIFIKTDEADQILRDQSVTHE